MRNLYNVNTWHRWFQKSRHRCGCHVLTRVESASSFTGAGAAVAAQVAASAYGV